MLDGWEAFVNRVKSMEHEVVIGIVGKYVHLADTYKSLNEALFHGGVANDAKVELSFVELQPSQFVEFAGGQAILVLTCAPQRQHGQRLRLGHRDLIRGTTHAYIGEEAIAVGTCAALNTIRRSYSRQSATLRP